MGQLGTSQLGTSTLGGTLPESDSNDPVETVVDILGAYGSWSLTSPEVYPHEKVDQRGKENNPNPAIYVWSPVDTTIEQFSSDTDRILESHTIECQIWTHDNSNTFVYYRDVIDLLQRYAGDNYANINFHHIRPESTTDSRSEHIQRITDHYIISVQAEVVDLHPV